ncbi:EAL domain-containing protein [Lysobacter sp. GX 14042]|uniref:EAL domain-containing protein n=1 Tax=Lysobacter sp. GX 14042 TaxID=2907155 RepID=UPI001F1C2003|nr:EAL domain-containing protein [Lysobacter sp. GX 14042]
MLLVVLSPTPRPAHGQTGDPTLVVGGDAEYPPFQFIDEHGRATGFDVELIRLLARDQRMQVRFELGGWDASLKRLERGELDVVPMFASSPREDRFLFTRPYLLRYHAVFGTIGTPAVGSLEELAGSVVAVQKASLAWEALRAMGRTGPRLLELASESTALAAVARGEAEYALVPTSIGYQTVAKEGLDGVIALSPPLLERQYVLAVSRQRPELVGQLNDGLDRLRVSGEQDRLYVAWIGNLGRQHAPAGAWPMVAGVAAILALYLALLLWRRRAGQAIAGGGPAARGQAQAPGSGATQLAVLPGQPALLEQLALRAGKWTPGTPGFALAKIRLLGLDMVQNLAGEATSRDLEAIVAARLASTHGRSDVAYLGPGRFAVVLPGVGDAEQAGMATEQLRTLLSQRISLRDLPIDLRTRIGIAVFPHDGADAPSLMRAARLALEAAERLGVRRLAYNVTLEPDPRNLTLLAELRESLAAGQLGYALQPKLDLRTRRWLGAELLVRWNHPRHGPLPPAAFVPLAEQAEAIGEMTLYLIRAGLATMRQWSGHGQALSLAVNVSANDLADGALVDAVIGAAARPGPQLILEVTETDMMRDPERVAAAIPRLRAHGIRISVDDFGTGHSSLTNLRRLGPDELKIDQSFVANVVGSQSDQAIVRATISLAHDLGASVTAEGIEDQATLDWLAAAGCDAAQGFCIARPMPPEAFARLLQDASAPATS